MQYVLILSPVRLLISVPAGLRYSSDQQVDPLNIFTILPAINQDKNFKDSYRYTDEVTHTKAWIVPQK